MAKLEDITGKAISGEWGFDDEDATGIPVLRTTNFTNDGVINFSNVVTRTITKKDLSSKYLRPGDIIIEKSGGSDKQPVGRVVYYEEEPNRYLSNNFTGVLRIMNPNLWNSKYVFYALYANYLRGGTRKYQNKTTGLHNLKTEQYVREFELRECSIQEQRQIVFILDKLSEVISLRKEQLVKLDELVKVQFVEMFGNPVCNDKGWPLIAIGDIAEIRIGPFGTMLHKEDYIEGGHALINPSHIIDGKICIDPFLTVSNKKYSELSSYALQIGDVVLGRRGEMGRCAVVHEKGLLCGTGSMIIRPREEMKPYFLQSILSNPAYKKIIEDRAVGVTMMNLNIPIVSALQIPQLPMILQNDFIRFMGKADEQKLTIQQSLDKLEVLKKSLMQEYFG